MHYAHELAKRGFVCLVPDYPYYGEHQSPNKDLTTGYQSVAMKAVWDNIRGIDLLETMPEVNNRRIGIIGHGMGGQNALLTAAFDYRLAGVVSSCGFTTFPHNKNLDALRMPMLKKAYNNDPAKIPFDYAELIATIVQRGVFVSAPTKDPVMDVQGVKATLTSVTPVYQLRKAGGSLKFVYPEAGRDFPAATRTEAYTWLEQKLKR
jgi:dienelactone hydrolase